MKTLSALILLCAAALFVSGCSSGSTDSSNRTSTSTGTGASSGGRIGGVSAPSGGATSPSH